MVIGYLKSYRYKNAFRTLAVKSNAAKRDFMEAFCELLKKDVCIEILFLTMYLEYSWLNFGFCFEWGQFGWFEFTCVHISSWLCGIIGGGGGGGGGLKWLQE